MRRIVEFSRREEGTSSVHSLALTAGVGILAIVVIGWVQTVSVMSVTEIIGIVDATVFGK